MKIGILGGGQLAQMLAQAGESIEMDFAFVAPEKDACAAPFGKHLVYPYLDPRAEQELAAFADVVTYEFESIPVPLVQALEKQLPVHPSSDALILVEVLRRCSSTTRIVGNHWGRSLLVSRIVILVKQSTAMMIAALLPWVPPKIVLKRVAVVGQFMSSKDHRMTTIQHSRQRCSV